MIKFDTLAMKAETNDMHIIFLLKENVQADIIKTILGYLLIVAPDTLKEWKMVITSVGQDMNPQKVDITINRNRNDIWRTRGTHGYWKVLR